MIGRAEIEATAERFAIHTSHIQRDYVHGWLLSCLYSSSPLAGSLVLKGGNALRKGYFESTRYSRDLDFSTERLIPDDELGRELNLICGSLENTVGVHFDTERTRVDAKRGADGEKQISEARLYFRDFYGIESELVLGVRLDVTHFDRLHLPPQERALIHPYSDWGSCSVTIRCVKLEELLATKMRCLLQRRHIADLFDLVFAALVSREIEIDRRELLRTFFKMTIFERSPGVVKGLLIDLPLEALRRFWTHIQCPSGSLFSFETAKEQFLAFVEQILPVPAVRNRSETFFPSSLRNPIMHAAETLTLLRLSYTGVSRLVEPYSLVFKIRQDGVAREYFYGYDTTGSSPPGIKCFLPGRVEAIGGTDTTFTPRCEVELRKAGGSETVSHFEGRRGAGIGRRGYRYRPPEFEVECNYCLKRFRRRRAGVRLRQHRDRYGNPCYGRLGHRV